MIDAQNSTPETAADYLEHLLTAGTPNPDILIKLAEAFPELTHDDLIEMIDKATATVRARVERRGEEVEILAGIAEGGDGPERALDLLADWLPKGLAWLQKEVKWSRDLNASCSLLIDGDEPSEIEDIRFFPKDLDRFIGGLQSGVELLTAARHGIASNAEPTPLRFYLTLVEAGVEPPAAVKALVNRFPEISDDELQKIADHVRTVGEEAAAKVGRLEAEMARRAAARETEA